MPCKLRTKKRSKKSGETDDETQGSDKIKKTKHTCTVKAHESSRHHLERTQQTYHEDRIAGEGFNSLSHYNLVRKFVPMLQAMKSPDAKAAVDKKWKKLEKLPAWQLTKVRSKKEVILEAQEKTAVHLATLMDICHLKNSESEPKYQKYKGRVALRGDIVTDETGSYAGFTEQGSSASHMTAANVMDVMTRLPDCAGQAVDAVSACTQVKMEDAFILLKLPQSECPDVWIRLPRHKWPKSWSNIEEAVVPLERNQCGHPLAGLVVGKTIRGRSAGTWMGKPDDWECLFVHRKQPVDFCA